MFYSLLLEGFTYRHRSTLAEFLLWALAGSVMSDGPFVSYHVWHPTMLVSPVGLQQPSGLRSPCHRGMGGSSLLLSGELRSESKSMQSVSKMRSLQLAAIPMSSKSSEVGRWSWATRVAITTGEWPVEARRHQTHD